MGRRDSAHIKAGQHDNKQFPRPREFALKAKKWRRKVHPAPAAGQRHAARSHRPPRVAVDHDVVGPTLSAPSAPARPYRTAAQERATNITTACRGMNGRT